MPSMTVLSSLPPPGVAGCACSAAPPSGVAGVDFCTFVPASPSARAKLLPPANTDATASASKLSLSIVTLPEYEAISRGVLLTLVGLSDALREAAASVDASENVNNLLHTYS